MYMAKSLGRTFPVCPLQRARRQDNRIPSCVGTKLLCRSTLSVVHLRPRMLGVIYLSHMLLSSTTQSKTFWTALHMPIYSELSPLWSGSFSRPSHLILVSSVGCILARFPSTDNILQTALDILLRCQLKPVSTSDRFPFPLSRGISLKTDNTWSFIFSGETHNFRLWSSMNVTKYCDPECDFVSTWHTLVCTSSNNVICLIGGLAWKEVRFCLPTKKLVHFSSYTILNSRMRFASASLRTPFYLM